MNICKNVNLFLKKLTIWTHNSCLPFYCTSKKKNRSWRGFWWENYCILIRDDFRTLSNISDGTKSYTYTVWNVSKYGVFSGLYFPAFGLNTEIRSISLYSVRMRENTEQKKLQGSKCASDDDCCWILRKHSK